MSYFYNEDFVYTNKTTALHWIYAQSSMFKHWRAVYHVGPIYSIDTGALDSKSASTMISHLLDFWFMDSEA